MDRFIASLPPPVLAIIAIVAGFFVIVAYDPPKTVCDTQMEYFKEAQSDFVYGKQAEEGGTSKPALAKQMFEICKADNTPGGCLEYFSRLKKLSSDLENIPRQCADTVAKDEVVQALVFKSLKLMAQIAWGDRGPASALQRYGWFDASDMSIYCELNQSAQRLYGPEVYEEWRAGVVGSLPGADQMSPEQQFQKSLFSAGCSAFR